MNTIKHRYLTGLILVAAAGILTMTSCVKPQIIRDPSNEANWGYYRNDRNSEGLVLLNKKKEPITPSEKDKRYVATTGFINGIAFVARCSEWGNKKKRTNCLSTQIAMIDEEGHLLNSFAQFEYPELEVSLDYPGTILYLTKDGKREIFPMFADTAQIAYDGIHNELLTDGYFLIKRNGVFGYINDGGSDVIPARFLAATPFRDGKAVVLSDAGLGTLDKNGTFTAEKYACVIPYDEKLRKVNIGGKLLNYQRDLRTMDRLYISEALLNRINSLQDDVVCEGGKWGLIDSEDQVVIPELYTSIVTEEGTDYLYVSDSETQKVGFYTKDGKQVVESKYKSAFLGEYYFIVQNDEDKYALMDKSGKEITGFEYDMYKSKGQPDNIGFYLTSEYAVLNKNGKWGVLTASGKEIIPFEYEELGAESEGMIAYKKGSRWGVIDTNNKEILAPIYTDIGVFEDGRAHAVLAGDEIFVYRDQMTRQAWLEKDRLAKDRVEQADREAARESLRRQEEIAAQRLEEQRLSNVLQLNNERDRQVADLNQINYQIEMIEPEASLGVADAKRDLDALKAQRANIEAKIAEIDAYLNSLNGQPVPPPPPQMAPSYFPSH